MDREVYIGQKIIHLSRLLDRKVGKRVSQYGITNIQSRIINFVYKESPNREIFQKDIEEKFDIRGSSVTSVLKLMENNKYIKRVSVAEDGRLKKIVLMEKGIDLHAAAFAIIEDMEDLLSEALTQEELILFFELIDKLTAKVTD